MTVGSGSCCFSYLLLVSGTLLCLCMWHPFKGPAAYFWYCLSFCLGVKHQVPHSDSWKTSVACQVQSQRRGIWAAMSSVYFCSRCVKCPTLHLQQCHSGLAGPARGRGQDTEMSFENHLLCNSCHHIRYSRAAPRAITLIPAPCPLCTFVANRNRYAISLCWNRSMRSKFGKITKVLQLVKTLFYELLARPSIAQ